MRVQNITMRIEGTKLALQWELIDAVLPRALIVQFSQNPEFSGKSSRFVVLPAAATSIALDTGKGSWWVRVGALVGTEESGTVDWSGIYGPATVVSPKQAVGEFPARLRITWKEATLEGVRLLTDIHTPYYAFVTVSTGPEFRVGDTRMIYMREPGKGVMEIDGFVEGTTYAVQVRAMEGPIGELPVGGRIAVLAAPVEAKDLHLVKPVVRALGSHLRGTVDTATRQATGTDHANAEAHRVLLREARNKPVQRFSSYADYMRMVQAQTLNRVK
jgi:hypothetical protein